MKVINFRGDLSDVSAESVTPIPAQCLKTDWWGIANALYTLMNSKYDFQIKHNM